MSAKNVLIALSMMTTFSGLTGCNTTKTIHAPIDYDSNVMDIQPTEQVIYSPKIGDKSLVELGDSLVSKHKFLYMSRFTLKEEHIISDSGAKRQELKDICWMSGLLKGNYVAFNENSSHVYYSLAQENNQRQPQSVYCTNGSTGLIGFASPKNNPNEFFSFYRTFWNLNDKVNPELLTKNDLISAAGIFKQEFYYNGKVNNQLRFSYREFTDKGIARDSFSQDVVYDLTESNVIGFKGAKFKVIKATNTTLEYVVLSHFK
jgi:hypothetical protein